MQVRQEAGKVAVYHFDVVLKFPLPGLVLFQLSGNLPVATVQPAAHIHTHNAIFNLQHTHTNVSAAVSLITSSVQRSPSFHLPWLTTLRHKHTHTQTDTDKCTHKPTHTHTYMYACTHTHILTHTDPHTHVHTHTHR